MGIEEAVVPGDLPVAVADRLRDAGETLVVAIEPGIEGIDGVGGVRFEELLLITEDGSETLTRYSYDL